MHHWRFQNKIYSVDVPMCSSSHSSIFTVRNFKCSTFYREKTKKLCLQCKCQDPMNSLTLHQTSECQYSASILRRRHKSENVVKFYSFDLTLLWKVYIIQLLSLHNKIQTINFIRNNIHITYRIFGTTMYNLNG